MIPENLTLLVGQVSGDQATAVEKVFKGCSLAEALIELGRHWKLRVWFDREHTFRCLRRSVTSKVGEATVKSFTEHKTANVYTFASIILYQGMLYYRTTRNSRKGYQFPSLDTVIKYEPVLQPETKDEFNTLAEFASRFDQRFITQSEISRLWAGTSAQHGGKYKPSDFHRIGPQGKKVLNSFLQLFVDVNTEGKCYCVRGDQRSLESYHHSQHQLGRDIRLSHTLGKGYVRYSSEYPGRGNGRYGLLANKNEFLWLEDD
jgi:hypothetical protein